MKETASKCIVAMTVNGFNKPFYFKGIGQFQCREFTHEKDQAKIMSKKDAQKFIDTSSRVYTNAKFEIIKVK